MPALIEQQNKCWKIELQIENINKENDLIIEELKIGRNEEIELWESIKKKIVEM